MTAAQAEEVISAYERQYPEIGKVLRDANNSMGRGDPMNAMQEGIRELFKLQMPQSKAEDDPTKYYAASANKKPGDLPQEFAEAAKPPVSEIKTAYVPAVKNAATV